MDSSKRSTSVDTLSEYVAQIQTSSAGTSGGALDPGSGLPSSTHVDHILLSCTLNTLAALNEQFTAEQIPIETPEYMREVQACTESDLYFLRWVFEGCFDALTTVIEHDYKGFKVLRAEAEPGISWAEFREGKRGFLVWLVRAKPRDDPLAALKDLLTTRANETDLEDSAALGPQVSDREAVLASIVGKQLGVVRRQMRQFYKEMEETERQMADIWQVVSHAGLRSAQSNFSPVVASSAKVTPRQHQTAPLTATALASSASSAGGGPGIGGHGVRLPVPVLGGECQQERATDWSVVDEDEDRELTSLSGYDSVSDGET